MKNPLLIFLLFLSVTVSAQYHPDRVNKKAVAKYNQAIQLAQDGNLRGALPLLHEAIKLDGRYVEAYLSLGGVYGQLKDPGQSILYYEKAFAIDSNYTSDFRLPYSINLASTGEFEKALSTIQALLARENLNSNTRKAAEYRLRTYQFAVDYSEKTRGMNYVFAPKNLGDGVNSADSEYFPSMPVDSRELIFTRRIDGFNEDFFGSRQIETEWGTAVRLNGSINTPQNEGAQTVSQDGNWLIFTGCNRRDGFGSCDLYISYLTEDGWSEAMNLGSTVNSDQWESQPSLSPDKRQLYFASRRPGGFGGSDIYVSNLLPDGRWSEPMNLGPRINTAGDESSPFIHADNQTLYFTSNGLPGYGEEDLFLVRKDDSGKWGEPVNLGYPVNTVGHEGTLFIASDGKTAYYASDRSDSRGGLDIYSFELRPDIRPHKTLWVKGKVFDSKTGAGLPSTVELTDLATRQVISRVQTDETGNYMITLPIGKDYAFNVNRRDYLFYSDNYLLKEKDPDSTYVKDIALQPIEVNAAIVLRNIFFDFGSHSLRQESQVELDKVVQLLKDNPTVRIQIEGHTDNIGGTRENQLLSEQRARAVVGYLVSAGIRAERLTARGFGEAAPVADNSTEDGRALNRRTALKITAR